MATPLLTLLVLQLLTLLLAQIQLLPSLATAQTLAVALVEVAAWVAWILAVRRGRVAWLALPLLLPGAGALLKVATQDGFMLHGREWRPPIRVDDTLEVHLAEESDVPDGHRATEVWLRWHGQIHLESLVRTPQVISTLERRGKWLLLHFAGRPGTLLWCDLAFQVCSEGPPG